MVLIFCILSTYLSPVQVIMTDFGFTIDLKPLDHTEQQNIGFLFIFTFMAQVFITFMGIYAEQVN